VEHYRQNISRRHLDVGPGTGYFLEHAGLGSNANVVLLDPNPHVLVHAARRLTHLAPSVVRADVCKPLPLEQRFESAALNFVLHCLPGPMSRKAGAIRNVAAVLEPGGVLFGATVLGTPELHTWLSRMALRYTNQHGIFDNLSDTAAGLHDILQASFKDVTVKLEGSVAVFAVSRPRSTSPPST
jgi:SAM-dependent methyltransferase